MTNTVSRVRPGRRVLIICQLDGFSNSDRPLAMRRFLQQCGHEVHIVNTYALSRASGEAGSARNRLPALDFRKMALYGVEAASKVLVRRWAVGRRHLSYYSVLADHRLRRAILKASLPLDDYDLVICETPYDSGVLTVPSRAHTLLDCPTPWADELFLEGLLTARQHQGLRVLEKSLFEEADHLSFGWESYADYALEHYGVSGHNLLQLNWGCTPAADRARFADPPRVVYLGSLASRFIDLPLLARLNRSYPHIDVYGGPPPDRSLGLNYRGYASPDVLLDYQLGLITCTRDALRRDGFSAKHLAYLAYGLPVLVPRWRRRLDLLRGSVPYTEETFRSVIGTLSHETHWNAISDEAYEQSRRLDWNETLRPLAALLSDADEQDAAVREAASRRQA